MEIYVGCAVKEGRKSVLRALRKHRDMVDLTADEHFETRPWRHHPTAVTNLDVET